MRFEIEKDELKYVSPPEEGEMLEVTKKIKNKDPLPPYNIVGNGLTGKHGTSVDLLEVCLQLNIAEMKLLQFFRTQFTARLIAHVDMPSVVVPTVIGSFDKYLATALMKNYKHMEYLQILRRIKRGEYILNPKIFMPPRGYTEAVAKWDSIKVKEQ